VSRVLRAGLLLLVLLLAAAAAMLVRSGIRSIDEPLNLTGPLRFKVPAGASFAHVAAQLAAQGVVTNPRAWVLWARWRELASAVKAGEYEVEPGATPRSLLDKLVSGQVLLHSFTIVDGWRLSDLLAALRRNADIASSADLRPENVMAKIGAPGPDAEGQFLPETYRFPFGTADIELLRQAHAALIRELQAAWASRTRGLPLQNAGELLIMASIVEKESALAAEVPKIAGLYLHRLSLGMRLQADPTVIYGLGERYDGSLHTVDLRTDGPYNSYTRAGLPPTPIALPGAAALRATARPDATDALYFVASGKGDGSHVFSATLQQHNQAVARYWSRPRP
jgi:UPF0755 protein